MEQLISSIVSKMGLNEAVAEKAVGVVLSLVKSQGDDSLVGQLFDKIPGAADLADKGTNALSDNPGGGGLMGMIGGLVGGGGGEIMSAISLLQSDGLDTGQIRELGGHVLDYAKKEGGDDLVNQITSSIPGLDKLL